MMNEFIENYGLIGDLRTAALVGLNGSIDFMCYPQFDSPSIFARLLDQDAGYYQISTKDHELSRKQHYLIDTNILTTQIHCENGIGELTDFMSINSGSSKLIRQVKTVKGSVNFILRCCPRFNYAREGHQAKVVKKNKVIFFKDEKPCLTLYSSIPLKLVEGDALVSFCLKEGESLEFLLTDGEERIDNDLKAFSAKSFDDTNQYWKKWVAQSTYKGLWRDYVIRSALVLKLLISQQYGSIIAAPTFSLPEKIGGKKNWDYRFSWIRDSSFTVNSLLQMGFIQEAEEFINWIDKVCEGSKTSSIKPLYSLNGKEAPQEKKLSNLKGYMNSSPVRIGNAANQQIQLDIYGEYTDALYLYDKKISSLTHESWLILSQKIKWVEKNWKIKDWGIWEIRGKPQEFLYSKVMAWVALDRAIKIGIKNSFPYPASWVKTRDEIYNYIFDNFWNKKKKSFVQYKNSKNMDASTLLLPLVKFISSKDPKWISTLKCIEKELIVECHVYRYLNESELTGLKGDEGTFSACSFWYIQCLARSGQLQKASDYFDKMLSYANHLGLYSEELSMEGTFLGNFPQGLTHLSLISAAVTLDHLLQKTRD